MIHELIFVNILTLQELRKCDSQCWLYTGIIWTFKTINTLTSFPRDFDQVYKVQLLRFLLSLLGDSNVQPEVGTDIKQRLKDWVPMPVLPKPALRPGGMHFIYLGPVYSYAKCGTEFQGLQ